MIVDCVIPLILILHDYGQVRMKQDYQIQAHVYTCLKTRFYDEKNSQPMIFIRHFVQAISEERLLSQGHCKSYANCFTSFKNHSTIHCQVNAWRTLELSYLVSFLWVRFKRILSPFEKITT